MDGRRSSVQRAVLRPLGIRVDELVRYLRPAPEEELLHFCLEEFACLRLDRRKPVLVDQDRLVRKPFLPRLFGHVAVDPLAELSRIRAVVETFRAFATASPLPAAAENPE